MSVPLLSPEVRYKLLLMERSADLNPQSKVLLAIDSIESLAFYLTLFGIELTAWKPWMLRSLWTEIERGETALLTDGLQLVRSIRTVTLRIYYDLPDPTNDNKKIRLFLCELQVFHDGRPSRVRKHPNSMSEKLMWYEAGDLDAVRRALLEELTPRSLALPFIIREEYLKEPFLVLDDLKQDFTGAYPSGSFPGLLTENELHHYIFRMPDVLFDPEGYIEIRDFRTTYFNWTSDLGSLAKPLANE